MQFLWQFLILFGLIVAISGLSSVMVIAQYRQRLEMIRVRMEWEKFIDYLIEQEIKAAEQLAQVEKQKRLYFNKRQFVIDSIHRYLAGSTVTISPLQLEHKIEAAVLTLFNANRKIERQ
jgi:hypothetical protein